MIDLPDLRSGVYRHYKGRLYQVMGYSHNASDEGRAQVLYFGLYTDREQPGPRFATRDPDEFFEMVCTIHEGMEWHSKEHADLTVSERLTQSPRLWTEQAHQDDACVQRFTYLGPVYYRGMEKTD